jgi:hypothetical protein
MDGACPLENRKVKDNSFRYLPRAACQQGFGRCDRCDCALLASSSFFGRGSKVTLQVAFTKCRGRK